MSVEEYLMSLGFDHPAVKLWMRTQVGRKGYKLDCGPYAWDLTKDSRVIRIGRQHYARVTNLAADFDGLFKTLVPIQAGHQTVLDFSHIQLHRHRESGLKFELAQWPEPDAVVEAYLEQYHPAEDDLVFDLGAGCGISSYALSNMAKRVISFEPDAQLRVILERNIERHKMTNVVVEKGSATHLMDLITQHSQPAFCKINLDQLNAEFCVDNAAAWSALPMKIAAHSKSESLRERFTVMLNGQGFETGSNVNLGVVWARRPNNAAH